MVIVILKFYPLRVAGYLYYYQVSLDFSLNLSLGGSETGKILEFCIEHSVQLKLKEVQGGAGYHRAYSRYVTLDKLFRL